MLSTFDPPLYEGSPLPKLEALRALMRAEGLDYVLVPHADEYRNEYLAAYAERLAWLTHYTGSLGVCLVGMEDAILYAPHWYVGQAEDQTDLNIISIKCLAEETPLERLSTGIKAGMRFGIDPKLHNVSEVEAYNGACAKAGAELILTNANLVDRVWTDQPPRPQAPVVPHPLEYSGMSSWQKRHDIAKILREAEVDALIVMAVDAIAWLLNVRGQDIPITPLPFSRLLLWNTGKAEFFVDRGKVTNELADFLGDEVRLRDEGEFSDALSALGRHQKSVHIDIKSAPFFVVDLLQRSGAKINDAPDPCAIRKAVKNTVEIKGARRAHQLDGIALVRFLAWLDEQIEAGEALDEHGVAMKLASLRRELPGIKNLSFASISGAGPNSAKAHYVPTPQTSRPLQKGDLFMIDSGGQYPFGTTDVTRTIPVGEPSAEMRDRFTRVLKGHIALARARFPGGVNGYRLDILARLPLWEAGLNYDHGTGHGVGSYLCVHEGPQNISAGSIDKPPLEARMIMTIEPGYYKPGAYGMRIENIALISEAPPAGNAERPNLQFEILTRAPIDKRLILIQMLNNEERAWLDAYHERVCRDLSPALNSSEKLWLEKACAPLEG